MDRGGRFFNAADKVGELVRGDERLDAHRMGRLRGQGRRQAGDRRHLRLPHQLPPSGHDVYHESTVADLFVPTTTKWKEPITVKAGQLLSLAYGVALWDGEVDRATVETLYQRWLKLSPEKS